MNINETIKTLIEAQGSKMSSVTFVKKDGSVREMTIQLAAMAPRIKGTKRGQQQSATRKANHPELMPVYSIDAHAFRSINLNTVLSVRAGGTEHVFRKVQSMQGYELRDVK